MKMFTAASLQLFDTPALFDLPSFPRRPTFTEITEINRSTFLSFLRQTAGRAEEKSTPSSRIKYPGAVVEGDTASTAILFDIVCGNRKSDEEGGGGGLKNMILIPLLRGSSYITLLSAYHCLSRCTLPPPPPPGSPPPKRA